MLNEFTEKNLRRPGAQVLCPLWSSAPECNQRAVETAQDFGATRSKEAQWISGNSQSISSPMEERAQGARVGKGDKHSKWGGIQYGEMRSLLPA